MTLVATFRQPFDLLAKTTAIAATVAAAEGANSDKSEIWLGKLDTYKTMCIAPEPEFRSVLEQVRALELAA